MLRRYRWLAPYLFLLPGGLWLLAFFVVPLVVMASVSLQEGSLSQGYRLTWNFGVYPAMVAEYWEFFVRSVIYALVVTGLTLLLGYPLAYTIAFRGGRA
jgi:spermidine/putrescine transport system permease protein